MKIALLYDEPGGIDTTPDRADILDQLKIVRDSLSELAHDPFETGFSLDLKKVISSLKEHSPDMVFNLVESVEGEGRLIYLAPAILDILKIPFTGASTDAMYMTSNKLLAKEILINHGIPAPEGISPEDAHREARRLKGDYIIKSVWEHASIGIDDSSIVTPGATAELLNEMEKRRKHLGGQCFAEKYIEGREFNISILAGKNGPEILPPAEIRFVSFDNKKRKMVGYKAKWDQDSFEYCNTVRSFDFFKGDDVMISSLCAIAGECWDIFGIRGYCRVDFRVDENNLPWVLEVNANPCLSSDAGFMAAAERAGIKPIEVIKRIIDDTGVVHVPNKTHI